MTDNKSENKSPVQETKKPSSDSTIELSESAKGVQFARVSAGSNPFQRPPSSDGDTSQTSNNTTSTTSSDSGNTQASSQAQSQSSE